VQQRPPATVSLLLLSMLPPPLLLLLLVLLLVSPGAHAVTPVVLHAWSFPRDVISTAFAVLENGGDALPAVVRGTQQAELNPEVHNVGPGGTPDSAGETTLDAMLMDGDTLNMGAVGALRGVSSAIYVASLVLRHTAHTLLAGSQATDFARTFGGQEVKDISTDYSSAAHSRWLSERSCQPNFWEDVAGDTGGCGTVADRPLASSCGVTPMSPAEPGAGTAAPYGRMAETPGSLWDAAARQGDAAFPPSGLAARGRRRLAEDDDFDYIGGEGNHDTIPMLAVDASGSIAAATTTNGLSYKIPGRVGDSPIPGAGNYAITGVGGCGATGDGDIMMRFLPCYQAVESMRLGLSPKDAAEDAIARIRETYPEFSGAVITVDAEGNHAAATNDIRRPFPYTYQEAGMAEPVLVQVPANRHYVRPALSVLSDDARSGSGSSSSEGISSTMLVLFMLGALVVGGVGGFKMGTMMNDRHYAKARYGSVGANETGSD
jgi:N4-(beta-N-acetylglucosaminyl)-L-asparaginase